jgi:poly(A) polymerase
MAELNGEGFKNQSGEALLHLVKDYLEDITDWEQGIAENYKSSFAAARAFVLPMNPPRFELDHAVRLFFASHGIVIKKTHIMDRLGGTAHEGGEVRTAEAKGHLSASKRRRRRHKSRPKDAPQ